MNEGFYRLINDAIVYAGQKVITQQGTFNVSEHENQEYPIDGGWHYFSSVEEAEGYFNSTVKDVVPTINGIPQSISPAQCLIALDQLGKLDTLEAMMESEHTPRATKIAYNNMTVIERDSPMVNQMALGLQMNGSEVDNLFVIASGIKL